MYYKLDLIKLARQLIPAVLRGKRFFAFMRILLLPFVLIYKLFVTFRKEASVRQAITGQVIMIEKMLNDSFALSNREIYLSDAPLMYLHLYKRAEHHPPVALYLEREKQIKRHLLFRREGQYSGNFIVNIPSFLVDKIEDVKRLIEFYKPAGRMYQINIYEYE